MSHVNCIGMKKPWSRQLQHRIIPDYNITTRLSMDLKVMPRYYKGHTFILVVIDEVINFMVTIPIH